MGALTRDGVGVDALTAAVRVALADVYDPCSVAAGRPLSLVDMGLFLDARLDAGTLHVRFAVTFAGCTMAPHFLRAAETELARLPGVERVAAVVDTTHVWSPPPLPAPAMHGEPQAWRRRVSRG